MNNKKIKISKKTKSKIVYSIILIVFALTFRFLPDEIALLDKKGDQYFNTAIKETFVLYGITRLTNALVSVAKDTQITITPAGLGITLSIGQVLDPLDDATERLSTVLTISFSLLGFMKILKEILTVSSFKIISYLLVFLALSVWIKFLEPLKKVFITVVILIISLRIALPICGFINDYLYENFFQTKIEENLKTFQGLKDIGKQINPEDDNIFSFKKKIENTTEIAHYIWENRSAFIKAIINFIILEVSLIALQVIILPLGTFLTIYTLFNSIFKSNYFSLRRVNWI